MAITKEEMRKIVTSLCQTSDMFPCGNNHENSEYSFRWYKVNNIKELRSLLGIFAPSNDLFDFDVQRFPEWICVELLSG